MSVMFVLLRDRKYLGYLVEIRQFFACLATRVSSHSFLNVLAFHWVMKEWSVDSGTGIHGPRPVSGVFAASFALSSAVFITFEAVVAGNLSETDLIRFGQ